MSIQERVKTALRISHDRLDDEILETIETARSELIRSGVALDKANADDPLVKDAIVAFCMSKMASADNDKYAESFQYQQDNLRKSTGYKGGA